MKDLLTQEGQPENELSKRMADNVVQTLVAYMQAPSAEAAEAVHAYSTALSSLSLLAIAEQLQALAAALEPLEPLEPDECSWSEQPGHAWIGACGYETGLDGEAPLEVFSFCPGCGMRINAEVAA